MGSPTDDPWAPIGSITHEGRTARFVVSSFEDDATVALFTTKGKNLGAVPPAPANGASAATQADSATSQVKQSKKQHEKASGHQKAEQKAAKDKTKSHGHSQGSKSKKSK